MASFGRFANTRQQRREAASLLSGTEMKDRYGGRPPPSAASLESAASPSDGTASLGRKRESAWPISRAAATLVLSLIVLVLSIVLARHNARGVRSLTTSGCRDFERHFCPESGASAVARPPSSTAPSCPTPPPERWPITVRGGNRATRHHRATVPLISRPLSGQSPPNHSVSYPRPPNVSYGAISNQYTQLISDFLRNKMYLLSWSETVCGGFSGYRALLHVLEDPNTNEDTTELSFQMLLVSASDALTTERITTVTFNDLSTGSDTIIGSPNQVSAIVAGSMKVETNGEGDLTLTTDAFELPLGLAQTDQGSGSPCGTTIEPVPFTVDSTVTNPADVNPDTCQPESFSTDLCDRPHFSRSFRNGIISTGPCKVSNERWARWTNYNVGTPRNHVQAYLKAYMSESSQLQWTVHMVDGSQTGTAVSSSPATPYFYAKALSAEAYKAAFESGGAEYMRLENNAMLTFGLLTGCSSWAPLKAVATHSSIDGHEATIYEATPNHPNEFMNVYRIPDATGDLSSDEGRATHNTVPGTTMVPLFFLVYAYVCTNRGFHTGLPPVFVDGMLHGCNTHGKAYDVTESASAWWTRSSLAYVYAGSQQQDSTSAVSDREFFVGRTCTAYDGCSDTNHVEWSEVVKAALDHFNVRPCDYSYQDSEGGVGTMGACVLFQDESSGNPSSCSA